MSRNRPDDGPHRAAGARPAVPRYAERAQRILRQRRSRAACFPDADGLFRDPAWDILLHLFVSHELGRHDSVLSASKAANGAPATGERWIRALASAGLVRTVRSDAAGDRAGGVAIAPGAAAMMYRFLDGLDDREPGAAPPG